MLNKPIFHKKIPTIDQFNSVEEAFNYMAMVANSSFLGASSFKNDTIVVADTFSDHNVTVADNGAFTLSHGLGVIPTGWYVIDSTQNTPSALGILQRTAWDGVNISFINRGLIAGNVNYKIRVFI